MAELETVLFTRLSTYAGLIALTSTRIYPLIMPQNPTLPAVTYQRIDGPRESAFSAEMGLAHPRIQVDSWAKTYAGAKAVATQVRTALQRWSSEAVDPVVLDCLLESDGDEYEPDANIYRVRQDWIVWHRE
jgi:hypothetical protein